jgi:multiple sugar transport system substrate-binding protein
MNKRGCRNGIYCLIAVIMIMFLNGCGKNKKQADRTTLIFACGAGIEFKQVFEKVATAFESRHPEIKVDVVDIQGVYYAKLMTMIAGNTAPDIMWMGQSFTEFASRGAFLDLTLRIQKEIDINKYYERVVDWYRYNGKYYGFPYGVDTDMLFYNKDLFDKAGLPYPNEKWTIKDLVENAQKLTVRDKNGRIQQYGFVGGYDLGPFGAAILNADNTKCTLDRPEAIEALQFNVDLKKKYRVAPVGGVGAEAGGTGMTDQALFASGRVAMYRGYTWNLPDFKKKINAFDWDISLVPIAKKRSQWASSQGCVISSQTKHPEEAWIFLKFFISPEAQRITSAISMPVCLDVAREVIKTYTPPPANMKACLEAIPYLQPFPRFRNTSKMMEEYGKAGEEAEVGVKTPKEAFLDATRAINNILKTKK